MGEKSAVPRRLDIDAELVRLRVVRRDIYSAAGAFERTEYVRAYVPPPPDPEGDKILARLIRRYGLEPYDKYLDKVRERVRLGIKQKWPEGHRPKTRNPNAPAGKRWGHWEKGEKNV